MKTRRFFILSGVALLMLANSRLVCQAEPVVVLLKNGRRVSGEVDSRTNQEVLWLRVIYPGIVLQSAFAWPQVDSAQHGDETLSAKELRARAPSLKTKLAADDFPQNHQPAVGIDAADPSQIRSRSIDKQIPTTARVQSLHIEAIVANWDDDVEVDGLRVFVYPLDAQGRAVAVNGNISVRLFGQQFKSSTPSRWRRRLQFPELERWSVRVRESDFGDEGAVYNLRFRRFHPDRNVNVAQDGLLNARLAVAGNRTVDASDANVNLRPFSRFRDDLQQRTGSRFLRREFTRRDGYQPSPGRIVP